MPADPKGDWRQHAIDYKNAMADLTRKYPDDLDAATLYAKSAINLRPWRLYDKNGTPAEGTDEIVKVLEWVLARNPNHVGHNHYYIHATEASTKPERHAMRPAPTPTFPPRPATSFTCPRTSTPAPAITPPPSPPMPTPPRSTRSTSPAATPREPFPTMYYSHNLHFLAFAAAMAGRSKEAADAASRLSAHIEPGAQHMAMLDGFAAAPTLIYVRQNQWNEVNKSPSPPTTAPRRSPPGTSPAAWPAPPPKDVGPALQELEAMKSAAARAKDIPMGNNAGSSSSRSPSTSWPPRSPPPVATPPPPARNMSRPLPRKTNSPTTNPPPSLGPSARPWARALVLTGDPAAAEKVFRDDLVHTPNNPRSLFGLSESLKAKGRHADAAKVRKQFDTAWATADTKLRLEDFSAETQVAHPFMGGGANAIAKKSIAPPTPEGMGHRRGGEYIEICSPGLHYSHPPV